MSIPARLLRLLRAELNHRLSADKPPYKPRRGASSTPRDNADDAWEDGGPETSRTSSRTGVDPKLAAHYRALELPYGADLPSVRAAYKRLMKLYHPDRYQDPVHRETATEVVKRINAAYGDLVRHLEAQQTGK